MLNLIFRKRLVLIMIHLIYNIFDVYFLNPNKTTIVLYIHIFEDYNYKNGIKRYSNNLEIN